MCSASQFRKNVSHLSIYLSVYTHTHTHTHKNLWGNLVKIGEGYMGIFVLFLATFCNFKLCHIKTFERCDKKPQISIFSHFFKMGRTANIRIAFLHDKNGVEECKLTLHVY